MLHHVTKNIANVECQIGVLTYIGTPPALLACINMAQG
jgi:hypothetical protein